MNQRLLHAIEYAVQKHVFEMKQVYGLLPFSHHLEHVWNNVLHYSMLLETAGYSLEDLHALECAAWLHDVLEDVAGVKRRDLQERFGTQVESLVYLVTDEPFPMPRPKPPRKIRHALTYEKVRTSPLSVYLKLCDRIANVKFGGEAMNMYREEYEGFKRAVYTAGSGNLCGEQLETELLIGDREGVLFKQPAIVHARRDDSPPRELRNWTENEALVALPEEGNGKKPGYLDGHNFGLETFPAGIYPSCSRHGAMVRVSVDTDWWRCVEPGCNIGCEWLRGHNDEPHRRENEVDG